YIDRPFHFNHSTSKSLLCRTKHARYLLSPFVLIWHVPEKGPDRFYAWLVPLAHLKKCFSVGFS
ncbi:hypothetical protein, partial [Serratia marcescens]|uniref:hypothetical protein n=1 Tax=Serratia marcescens TaxID=615 RepID=UPI001966CF62